MSGSFQTISITHCTLQAGIITRISIHKILSRSPKQHVIPSTNYCPHFGSSTRKRRLCHSEQRLRWHDLLRICHSRWHLWLYHIHSCRKGCHRWPNRRFRHERCPFQVRWYVLIYHTRPLLARVHSSSKAHQVPLLLRCRGLASSL